MSPLRIFFVLLACSTLAGCSIPRAAELFVLGRSIPHPPKMHDASYSLNAIPAESYPWTSADFDSELAPRDAWTWYKQTLETAGWKVSSEHVREDALYTEYQTWFNFWDYSLSLEVRKSSSRPGPETSSHIMVGITLGHWWEAVLVYPRFLAYRLGFDSPAIAWIF